MRLPIGATDVTPSGGNVTLIGRRAQGWHRVGPELSLDDALAIIGSFLPTDLPGGSLRAAGAPAFLEAGREITWHYRRSIDTARVVRDDERGLVAWIPAGSARLGAAPASGGHVRDVALAERFRTPWVMRESTWHGAGVLRVAPTDRPWSVWFFRDPDGTPSGTYVNLELPHRRPRQGDPLPARTHTSDLVLDVWMDALPDGDEDVWLKDADELDAAVDQLRYTSEQRDAVRALADHACRELLRDWSWPMDEGWQHWQPTPELDAPITLPDNEIVAWARSRRGCDSRDG
ncbi:DUF402 domain-containing protein [Calidifontibacter indicus]|uniref:DUF402 domain-containing protein n=1 Tax=Calidifontibacter indicus TaxID=419650 RepID=UPI003D71D3FE